MNTNSKITTFACILAFGMLAADTASAGRVERFVVTGAIGAGIGQAIGHNTESTLIGAAAALLLDGYLNPSYRGNRHRVHPPVQHNAHYRHAPTYPKRHQVTNTIIYLPRRHHPPRHYVYRYPHKNCRHHWRHNHRRHDRRW